MATYRQIQQSFAKLEKEAKRLRAAALKAIPKIRKQIEKFGITAEDLGFSLSAKPIEVAAASNGDAPVGRRKGRAGKKPVKAKPAAKYQDPKTGATWSGMGKPPNWIRDSKNRDAFLIGGAGAEAKVSQPTAPKAKSATKTAKKAVGKKKSTVATKKSAPAKKAAEPKAKAVKAPVAKKIATKASKPKSAPTKKGAKKAAPAAAPATLDAGTPS